MAALVRVRHLWLHRALRYHPQHSPHSTVRPKRRALEHYGHRSHSRRHGPPLHNLLDNGVLSLAKTKAEAKQGFRVRRVNNVQYKLSLINLST